MSQWNDGTSMNVEYSPVRYFQDLDLSPHLVPLGESSLSVYLAHLHHFGCQSHQFHAVKAGNSDYGVLNRMFLGEMRAMTSHGQGHRGRSRLAGAACFVGRPTQVLSY